MVDVFESMQLHPSENEDPQITLELKSERELTEKDLADLSLLASDEAKLLKEKERQNPGSSKHLAGSAIIHIQAKQTAQGRAKAKMPTDFILARSSTGHLIGYSIISFDHPRNGSLQIAHLAYLGVRSKYQHLGIGTKILQETHLILKRLGLSSYTTSARFNTQRLLDSLGMQYRENPYPENVITSGKNLAVSLK